MISSSAISASTYTASVYRSANDGRPLSKEEPSVAKNENTTSEKSPKAQSSVALKPSLLLRLRPETLDDCFMPEDVSRRLLRITDAQSVPDTVLYGSAGTGKSTIANLMLRHFDPANTYKMKAYFHNSRASDFRGLLQFAVTVGLAPGPKVCLIEDADCLTRGQQLQIFDMISRNRSRSCKFLLTTPSIRKIHHKLRSAMAVFSFEPDKEDRAYEVARMQSFVFDKLRSTGEQFDQRRVEAIVAACFPDIRGILSMIDAYGLDPKSDWPYQLGPLE